MTSYKLWALSTLLVVIYERPFSNKNPRIKPYKKNQLKGPMVIKNDCHVTIDMINIERALDVNPCRR